MMRISTRVFALTAACALSCGAAGCGTLADRFLPGRQAHSDRTSSAYPANPLVVTEQDRRLQDYLNRLDAITPVGETPGAYRPRTVQIPVLPGDLDLGQPAEGPFGPDAPTRNVRPPGEGPQPGRITPLGPSSPMPETETPEPATQAAPPPVTVVAQEAASLPRHPAESYSPEGQAADGDPLEAMLRPYIQMAEADPDNLDKQLQLRLMLAAAGLREQALQPIAALRPEDNARLADLLMMIMALRDQPQLLPTPQEAAEQVEALQRLTQKLQALADLKIPRLELCRTVNGYGNFEAFETNEFMPGAPMVVYCEVKNFSVEDRGDGRYSTVLDLELGLYDNLGVLVKPLEKDTGIEDISANRRNDFFLTTVYYVPADLLPGQYTLKAIIRDNRVNKVATRAAEITVLDPASASK